MPFCPQCGVELDSHVTHCPLCAAAVTAERPELVAPYRSTPESPRIPRLQSAYVRTSVFESVSVLLFSGALAVFLVDIFADWRIGWSLRVLVALVGAWCLAGLVVSGYRAPVWLHSGIVLNIGSPADSDSLHISPDNGTEPYGNIFFQCDIADDGAARCFQGNII